MKTRKIFLLPLLVVWSCSYHESLKPITIENAMPNYFLIGISSALFEKAKSDVHANEATRITTNLNNMILYNEYFVYRPSNASKKTTPISLITENTWIAYEWRDTRVNGIQISDRDSSYLWEYFFESPGQTSWLKFLNSEEAKDKSWGSLKVNDVFGADPSAIKDRLDWFKVGDQLNYKFSISAFNQSFTLSISNKTRAGTGSIYNGIGAAATLSNKYVWTADGHGSWQSFDIDGLTVIDSGSW